MKRNILSIIALSISLLSLGSTYLRVIPFEVTNDTYIGILATFMGISVTLLIGYQIFNAIEIKKEVLEQKKMTEELRKMNAEISKTIKKQEYVTNEGFGIISAMILYNKEGVTASMRAFVKLHSALVYSIKTDRADYEWIFLLLREYISNIDTQNFVGGCFNLLSDGRYVCSNSNSPYYWKELKDIIKEYTDEVRNDEKLIREDVHFCRIKLEYDRVMKLYYKRLKELLENPDKCLSPQEKYIITNPT